MTPYSILNVVIITGVLMGEVVMSSEVLTDPQQASLIAAAQNAKVK